MSVGTGIFLGAVVIALVALFLKTKDRWRWKRIGLVGGALLVGLPLLAIGWIYASESWERRPRPQQELWNVRLGDSEADVKFKKGKPSNAVGLDDPTLWVYAMNDAGETLPEVKQDQVVSDVYNVRFKNHRVRYVQKVVGDLPDFPNLGGVTRFSSIDEIIAALGQPSTVSRSTDETERIYSFARYNVGFEFSRGSMSRVALFDPKTGPLRYSKEAK